MLRTTDGFAGRCGIKTLSGRSGFAMLQTKNQIAPLTISLGTLNQGIGLPYGYYENALIKPLKVLGYVGTDIRPEFQFTGSVTADGNMTAVVEPEFDFTANGNVLLNGYAEFEPEFEFTASTLSTGNVAAVIDIGARPSAFDIAQAVWFGTTFDGLGANKVMEVLLAVAAGKTNIDTSGTNPVVTFRNVPDTLDRVTATMDGSERKTVVIE